MAIGGLPGVEYGRAAAVIAGILAASGVLVLVFPRAELRRRWRTWLISALVICGAFALGHAGAAALAIGLGVGGSLEYARLAGLRAADLAALLGACVAIPVLTLLRPSLLSVATLGALLVLAVLPALLTQDAAGGGARAARTAFGMLWLPVALSGLVSLGDLAIVACVAVACADVGSWCGGKALGRRGPLARRLSALSPAKTWGGVLGGAVFAAAALLALGSWTPARWLAVVCGAVAGDLLESMIKRGAGVKDAGRWLPGFGGLLDRIDSLLIAIVLLGVLS